MLECAHTPEGYLCVGGWEAEVLDFVVVNNIHCPFVFNGTIEGPRAPAVEAGRVTHWARARLRQVHARARCPALTQTDQHENASTSRRVWSRPVRRVIRIGAGIGAGGAALIPGEAILHLGGLCGPGPRTASPHRDRGRALQLLRRLHLASHGALADAALDNEH